MQNTLLSPLRPSASSQLANLSAFFHAVPDARPPPSTRTLTNPNPNPNLHRPRAPAHHPSFVISTDIPMITLDIHPRSPSQTRDFDLGTISADNPHPPPPLGNTSQTRDTAIGATSCDLPRPQFRQLHRYTASAQYCPAVGRLCVSCAVKTASALIGSFPVTLRAGPSGYHNT